MLFGDFGTNESEQNATPNVSNMEKGAQNVVNQHETMDTGDSVQNIHTNESNQGQPSTASTAKAIEEEPNNLMNLVMLTYNEQAELMRPLFELVEQDKLESETIEAVIALIDDLMKKFELKRLKWSAQTRRMTIMSIVSKLDQETQNCWRYRICSTDPMFENFINFLIERKFDAARREASKPTPNYRIPKKSTTASVQSKRNEGASTSAARSRSNSRTPSASANEIRCALCNMLHILKECRQFKKLSMQERECVVAKKNLCKACFSNAHNTAQCGKPACKECCMKHNPMLLHRK